MLTQGGKHSVEMSWTTVFSVGCQSPVVGLLWEGSGCAPAAMEAFMVVKPAPGFAGLPAQPMESKEFQEPSGPRRKPFKYLGHPSKKQMSSCLMGIAGFGELFSFFPHWS